MISSPGIFEFTDLTDVPHTFLGSALKVVSVNAGETGLEFSTGGSGGVPGGSNTQVQFNDSGAFGGDAELTYDKTTNLLTVGGAVHTSAIQAHTSAGLTLETQGGADIALFGAGGGQNATFYDGVKLNAQTASRILSTDASSNITALDTATYPSLTELSYVKGVTSAVQTQIGGKQDTLVSSTNIKTINGASVLGSGDLTVSGGGVSGQALVDFGSSAGENSIARVTVNTASALTTSIITVSPSGVTTAEHDPDDYQWDNISGYVSNIVNGVSFDIVGVAPNGSFGNYSFNYLIN